MLGNTVVDSDIGAFGSQAIYSLDRGTGVLNERAAQMRTTGRRPDQCLAGEVVD